MRFQMSLLSAALLLGSSVDAFAPAAVGAPHQTTQLSAKTNPFANAAAAAIMGATLWASPAALAPINSVAPMVSVANAKEMASGSGSRVNKDADSLLRYGLPINNKEVCYVWLYYNMCFVL